MARDDMAGIASMLLGLVMLVLCAVGASLLADRHTDSGRATVALQEETHQQDDQILNLRARVTTARSEWESANHALESSANSAKAAASRIQSARTRIDELTREKHQLEEACQPIPAAFEQYREQARRQARNSAIGEHLASIQLKSGKSFENVTIKRVTDVGIEINHQSGIARIDATDLPASWHDRFQWDMQRRSAILHEEQGALAALEPQHPAPPAESKTAGSSPPPAEADRMVEKLHASISYHQTHIRALKSERREAESNLRSGHSRSVPGSLESWDQKILRLNGEISQSQQVLQLAREKLSALRPGDPALSDTPSSDLP